MSRTYLLLCVRCIETNMLKYTIQNAQGTPTNGKIHSTEEVWVRKPLYYVCLLHLSGECEVSFSRATLMLKHNSVPFTVFIWFCCAL